MAPFSCVLLYSQTTDVYSTKLQAGKRKNKGSPSLYSQWVSPTDSQRGTYIKGEFVIIKRIIHTRISNHLKSFPSLSPFQSAYRPFHSTETALLHIQNDLLLAMDNKKVSALILLDLSSAFDTVDHRILLSRLSSYFGISGLALQLLTSYLQNRTQTVYIDSNFSPPSLLSTGIPQGSVLGPLLFSLYTTPLSQILQGSGVSFHFYADDTQLYISFHQLYLIHLLILYHLHLI